MLGCSNNETNKNKQVDSNIIIKNSELKNIIFKFYENAIHYGKLKKNDTISVSIWKNNRDVYVGLNSFKKLKKKYYIGKSNLDKLKIYFYTNDLDTSKKLIEIRYVQKDTISKDYSLETYNETYIYNNGKLEPMKVK